MGLQYLNAEEIRNNKDSIREAMGERSNYFVRSGEVMRLVKKYIHPQDQIVEIGAGGGELATELLAAGFLHLNLIDIDDYIKNEIRSKVRLDLRDVSFQKLPFEDNSMDMVLAIAIIEHLENPYLLIREAQRTLKQGGKFLIAIPYVFSLRSRLKFLFCGDLKGYNEHNNHITLFTQAVFRKMVLRDFRVISTQYSNGYIRLFGRKKNFSSSNQKLGKLLGDKVLFVLEKI